MTNQVDITSSKYLVKPNNLTTPYFNPEEIDISGKEDKTDHDADINRLEIDISGKENITDHNTDISNLQSQALHILHNIIYQDQFFLIQYEDLLFLNYLNFDLIIFQILMVRLVVVLINLFILVQVD